MKKIPVTFLEELEAEFCSVTEQHSPSGCEESVKLGEESVDLGQASKRHIAEQFELPLPPALVSARCGVTLGTLVVPLSSIPTVSEPVPLKNRKPPFYHVQKEAPAHRAMLHLAAKGYSVKEIADKLDRSPVNVNNILRQPMLQQDLVKEIRRVQGEDEEVVEVIKQNVVVAVKTLASIIKDEKARGSDRIAAANALLERRYGKANQPINRGTDVDLNKLSDSELAKMLPATESTGTA